jgi:hypothetical protein
LDNLRFIVAELDFFENSFLPQRALIADDNAKT